MSHIISNEVDVKRISGYLDLIRTNGCNKDVIYEILDGIIPKSNDVSIGIDISDSDGHAFFDSQYKLIHINEEMFDEYIKKYSSDMIRINSNLCNCSSDLYAYNLLYTLIHEVEHVYQYMFAFGYLDVPYDIVGDLYNKLFDYRIKDDCSFIIKRILLMRRVMNCSKVNFVLERNANVETCDLLKKVSKYESNLEILNSINSEWFGYFVLGYLNKKYNGSFDESFSKLWRKDLFHGKVSEDISFEDRVWYGLPINQSDRELMLRLR